MRVRRARRRLTRARQFGTSGHHEQADQPAGRRRQIAVTPEQQAVESVDQVRGIASAEHEDGDDRRAHPIDEVDVHAPMGVGIWNDQVLTATGQSAGQAFRRRR